MSLQVELLEQSFAEVKPYADQFVGSFYENLFRANPEAKPLFERADMASQKKMMLSSLVMVVDNLRRPDVLDEALRGLGTRHVQHGALPQHYPLVGRALLITLKQYLQEKWTVDVKDAWVDAYDVMSKVMLDGTNYSPAEIALQPKPITKSIAKPSNLATASMPQHTNTKIATLETKPLVHSAVGGATNSVAVDSEEFEYSHDSSKATMFAFAGGGIMGITATILALVF